MKTYLILSALALVVGAITSADASSSADMAGATKHTRTEFHFVVNATFERTAPLFGADQERKWDPEWAPQFVYPIPALDQPGMVFRVDHPGHSAVWVNTAFDLVAGHIQYVYVLNDVMTTLIDIHLTRESADQTGVTVVYERTALLPEANDHVEHFAKGDEKAGKVWSEAINGYFARLRGTAPK